MTDSDLALARAVDEATALVSGVAAVYAARPALVHAASRLVDAAAPLCHLRGAGEDRVVALSIGVRDGADVTATAGAAGRAARGIVGDAVRVEVRVARAVA